MNLVPLRDNIIVKRDEHNDQTASGILLAPNTKDKPQQAIVLACGPGVKDKDGKLIPLEVKVNDRIVYTAYAGLIMTIDRQEILILKESEILAVME